MRLTKFLSGLGAVDSNPMKKKCRHIPNFPFKQMLPAALRDKLSGKLNREKKAFCLQEMSVMLACFKKSGYEDSRCAKEVQAFVLCNENHMKQQKSTSHTGSGKYPQDVVESMLKAYPQKRN